MGHFGTTYHARGRFYDQLATMIDAGLAIDRALGTLAESGDRFGDAASNMRTKVTGGRSLSDGMRPEALFSPFEVHAVEAGERAGRLPEVLRRLSRHFEERGRARDRIGYGLLYPFVVLHGAILLPPLFLLFRDGLAAYAAAVVPILLAIYGGVAGVWWLYRVVASTETGKLRLDRFVLSLPVVGASRQRHTSRAQ